jgi:iron-sulfur cluster assembly protein
MLTMTDTAAEAVKAIVSRVPDVTETGGVRIQDSGGEQGFALTIAQTPEPTDTVVDSLGAHVFLDATAAAALDDSILDADLGQDGSVRFALAKQS